MVVGVDRILLSVRKHSGIRDPVDVDVEEGHEDSDDEALCLVMRISQGVPQRVDLALHLHDALVRPHNPLIEDDSICGREKVAQV